MQLADTRINILTKGSELIHKNGYNNTGIKDILDASGVPKGSFYHYFRSKEDFGLQVIDFFTGFFISWLDEAIAQERLSPLKRLEKFFSGFRELFIERDFQGGCPIGNFSLEMTDISPAFREKLNSTLETMTAHLAAGLKEAIKSGELEQNTDAQETAAFIIQAWEGSVMKMKASRSPEPLVLFEKMIFNKLLADKN